MTFKDLQKRIRLENPTLGTTLSNLLTRVRNKPFWIWNTDKHRQIDLETNGDCCFNHIVGLPRKGSLECPMFDYEKILYDNMFIPEYNNPLNLEFKNKHLWVKKATGLGVTEFMLRIMAWLCTKEDSGSNGACQMCIVTGPNIDIATKLIRRLKNILERKLGLTFTDKETVLQLHDCRIEAFPSNHLDSFRALDNPKFILLDEADMFRKGEQEDVRHVSERYIAKSNPFIVMVSTPNAPGGLFEKIEKESESECLYKRIMLDYNYGIGKIYTEEEIDIQKASPSFEREYNLKYLGKIGNVFSTVMIDKATALGEQCKSVPINQFCLHSVGIDPGFGSSKTAIVLTEHNKEIGKIRVLYSEEFEHPNPAVIADMCHQIYRNYKNTWFSIDGSNRGFVNQLKSIFGEGMEWDKGDCVPNNMKIIPVNFSTEHKQLLSHLYLLMNKDLLAIPPENDKLLISLRTAQANEYSLDKEDTSYDDLLDALRLSVRAYKIKTKEQNI